MKTTLIPILIIWFSFACNSQNKSIELKSNSFGSSKYIDSYKNNDNLYVLSLEVDPENEIRFSLYQIDLNSFELINQISLDKTTFGKLYSSREFQETKDSIKIVNLITLQDSVSVFVFTKDLKEQKTITLSIEDYIQHFKLEKFIDYKNQIVYFGKDIQKNIISNINLVEENNVFSFKSSLSEEKMTFQKTSPSDEYINEIPYSSFTEYKTYKELYDTFRNNNLMYSSENKIFIFPEINSFASTQSDNLKVLVFDKNNGNLSTTTKINTDLPLLDCSTINTISDLRYSLLKENGKTLEVQYAIDKSENPIICACHDNIKNFAIKKTHIIGSNKIYLGEDFTTKTLKVIRK